MEMRGIWKKREKRGKKKSQKQSKITFKRVIKPKVSGILSLIF